MELDIKKIFFLLLYKLWIIILCAIIGFVCTFFYVKAHIAPLYTSSLQMYVLSNENQINNQSISELNYTSRLVNTYMIFLKSEIILDKIRQYSKVNMTISELSATISANSINNTEVFKIYVTSTSSELSFKIANAIANVVPTEIVNISKANPIKVISTPKLPTRPNDKTVRYSFFGLIFSILISSIAIIIYDLLDTRIKDEGDIIDNFKYPIIGIIPKIDLEVS